MNEKLKKIDVLNKKLRPPKELGGMFLPKESPEQFDFVFVAEMPSMNVPKDWDGKSNYNFGKFDARCRFFQKMMIEQGVAGSYVTDIVKERGKPRKPTKTEIQKWLPFLLKEIEIIQPKVIIILGKRTYEASFKLFVKPSIFKEIKVDYVFHYSQQGAKTNVEVEQRFAEVVRKYKQID